MSSEDVREPQSNDVRVDYLHRAMTQAFDEEELKTLCFALGIDYDSLRGEGKDARMRELIGYYMRRDKLTDLTQAIYTQRPNLFWEVTKQASAQGTLSALATGRMLMATVGRLEIRMDRVEECIGRLRTMSAANLVAMAVLLVMSIIAILGLVLGG